MSKMATIFLVKHVQFNVQHALQLSGAAFIVARFNVILTINLTVDGVRKRLVLLYSSRFDVHALNSKLTFALFNYDVTDFAFKCN